MIHAPRLVPDMSKPLASPSIALAMLIVLLMAGSTVELCRLVALHGREMSAHARHPHARSMEMGLTVMLGALAVSLGALLLRMVSRSRPQAAAPSRQARLEAPRLCVSAQERARALVGASRGAPLQAGNPVAR